MKNRKGFTLVEVMIVVGVLALLAAIAIPNLLRAKLNANDASAQSGLKTIANALENYAIINGVYPANSSDLLTISPPYLNQDFFTGQYSGYTFANTLSDYAYTIVATPINTNSGSGSFTITTGAVLAGPF